MEILSLFWKYLYKLLKKMVEMKGNNVREIDGK